MASVGRPPFPSFSTDQLLLSFLSPYYSFYKSPCRLHVFPKLGKSSRREIFRVKGNLIAPWTLLWGTFWELNYFSVLSAPDPDVTNSFSTSTVTTATVDSKSSSIFELKTFYHRYECFFRLTNADSMESFSSAAFFHSLGYAFLFSDLEAVVYR